MHACMLSMRVKRRTSHLHDEVGGVHDDAQAAVKLHDERLGVVDTPGVVERRRVDHPGPAQPHARHPACHMQPTPEPGFAQSVVKQSEMTVTCSMRKSMSGASSASLAAMLMRVRGEMQHTDITLSVLLLCWSIDYGVETD